MINPYAPRVCEKLTLAVIAARLKELTHRSASQLGEFIRLFQPETVLGWHRELVRRKWTFPHKAIGGRPRLSQEIEELIVRMAKENPRWGYGKIQGELLKLSYTVSESAVRDVLKRHHIQPALKRNGSESWHQFMAHYKEQILACDFFHRGYAVVEAVIRSVLHRVGDTSGASGRNHCSSQCWLGNATSETGGMGAFGKQG